MPESVLPSAVALRRDLARLDLEELSVESCAALVEALAVTEKACAAVRARAAARAAASGAHRASGYRDPADWLAQVSGSSPGQARAALETAGALGGCPATGAALVAGELSLAQATEIVGAEREAPGGEAELVALAKASTLGALRDEARRRRLAAVDAEDLHARHHRARRFQHWRDEFGMVCGRFALPPEIGVGFVNRLDAGTDRIRRRARRSAAAGGSLEAREAHAADAFAAMVTPDPSGNHSGHRGRSADLVIVCDLAAWRRRHTHPGEPCHLIGGTPVPVPVARRLADDAFLKAVLYDGTRIHTVAHYGRHIPAHVRTALELGAPPEFQGAVCAAPGCGRRHGLEWDHIDPLANRGPTTYANLAARCWPHHHDKTDADRVAGLLGTYAGAVTGLDPP